MSERQIHFELISPEDKLVSEPVYMAEIPGYDGVFGILPGHSSMIFSLRPGVVKLHKNEGDNDAKKIFIVGGFADVTGTNCTVLAEKAIMVSDLDKDSLEQSLTDLNEDLGSAESFADEQRIREEIILTKTKIHALTGY
ncbi:MAG: ATP synthase F1 subunit epsilon [Alphaproteobacteria bacterium]|nr:ATP synthase F1 subunit epsilon [Alphaproteobacteria bacterium]